MPAPFSFKWNGEHYRFSLERVVNKVVKDATGKWKRDRAIFGKLIEDKTTAEAERDRLRNEIREGSLQAKTEPEPAKAPRPGRCARSAARDSPRDYRFRTASSFSTPKVPETSRARRPATVLSTARRNRRAVSV